MFVPRRASALQRAAVSAPVLSLRWGTRSSELALWFVGPLELEGGLWRQEGLCAFGANHS